MQMQPPVVNMQNTQMNVWQGCRVDIFFPLQGVCPITHSAALHGVYILFCFASEDRTGRDKGSPVGVFTSSGTMAAEENGWR